MNTNTKPGDLSGPREKERWHLTKAVPITLIVGMLTQLVVGVWLVRGLVAELHETRREGLETQRRVTALEQARQSERLSERLGVVESRTTSTEAAVLRVESDVKKLLERRP